MTLFIILLLLMLVLALIILLPTLLKPTARNIEDSAAQAVVYRDKLRELQSDRDNGTLSGDEYQKARQEVEREALEVMDGRRTVTDNNQQQNKATAVIVAVLLPVLAAAVYMKLGNWPLVDMTSSAMTRAAATKNDNLPPIDEMITGLEKRLADNPDDVEGWVLLAHTYRNTGLPGKAAEAYRKAIKLGADMQATLEQVVAEKARMDDSSSGPQQRRPSIAEMLEKITLYLKDNPQDGKAWAMLARLYLLQDDMPNAVKSYQRATELTTDNADLWADYADALASVDGNQLSGKPLQMIQRALELNPQHPKALWLAGTEAHLRNDPKASLSYWQRLLAVIDPDSSDAQVIRNNIEEAARLAGVPVEDVIPKANAASQGRSIRGMVRLDDKLKAELPEDAIVFVYAKARTGPQAPLAVVRKSVHELPFSFVLDDSMALIPQMTLSSVDEVVVSAHISRSGSAKRQPGDLQADAQQVSKDSDSLLRFTIDKVVP